MVAPAAVVARLTTTAPFCAAAVEMAGAAACVCVKGGDEPTLLPPPHPHNKTPAKIIAVSITAPARIPRLHHRRISARHTLPQLSEHHWIHCVNERIMQSYSGGIGRC